MGRGAILWEGHNMSPTIVGVSTVLASVQFGETNHQNMSFGTFTSSTTGGLPTLTTLQAPRASFSTKGDILAPWTTFWCKKLAFDHVLLPK